MVLCFNLFIITADFGGLLEAACFDQAVYGEATGEVPSMSC
jgi:hypothetical protein